MRVLFVYKYLTLGGCETVLRARLEGLDREGIESHAWFFHDLGGRPIFRGVEERVRVGDVAACRTAIEDGGYDLVATLDTEEIFPLFRRERVDLPVLVVEAHTPHLENLDYLRDTHDLPVAAYFVPSAHQGEVVAERVGENGGTAPIVIVPNPLRPIFTGPLPPAAEKPPRPVVAWIGRLDALKNWSEFVRVAGRAAESADVDFRLVGRAVDRDTVEQLLPSFGDAGIAARIRWYRGLEHDRVPSLLDLVRDSGGVAIATSRGESFGMIVAEAMARACACVVADRPPLSELADGGRCGALYSPGDVAAGAGAVLGLLRDAPARDRLGAAARTAILARHAPEAAIPALARALRAAATRARASVGS